MSKEMPDLVDDGTWLGAALARMNEVFPTNRGLRPIYLLMASAHRYAIDYVEQAPVIVLAATRGKTHVSRSECALIQEQLAKMCQSKAKLRDVMLSYGLPLPLRLLDARVLTSSRATVIRRLALMNSSTLAQIIPATRQKQNAWLQALQNWCDWMAHYTEDHINRCPFFEWAATNYPGVTYREANRVGHTADFVCAHADTFNPLWTRERARAEEQKWHDDLATAEMVECTGGPLDIVVEYMPLPLLWEYGGLRFVALQTAKALHEEGAAMHHCVASYWQDVVNGGSRIYSILENGNRVATLELTLASATGIGQRSRYEVEQLVGAGNSPPAPEVAKVVGTFVEEINRRPAMIDDTYWETLMETEYPKVLDSRKASTMMSMWTEYLRLSKEDEGIAILEICMYEALAELEADDEGRVVVPAEINGVKVVGVEGGIIIGGGLICDNDEKRFTFTQATLGDAINWLKAQRWKMSEQMVEELTKSVGCDRQEQPTQQASPQPAPEQPSKTRLYPARSLEELRRLGVPITNDLIISPVPRKR